MVVKNINDPHAQRVVAVLEVLLKKARAGQLPSFGFFGEETGRRQPIDGVVGRFRQDPHRIIGHLEVMKAKLTDAAVERAYDDFQESQL
jgi:hypothetical protein